MVVRSEWWKFGVMFRMIPNFTEIFQILTHSAPLRWRFYRFFIHTQSSRGNVRTTKGSHRCLSASLKGYPRAQWEIFTPIGGFVFFSPFHGRKAKRKASLASNHAGRKMFFQPSDWPAHQPNHHPKPQGWMDEHKAIDVFFSSTNLLCIFCCLGWIGTQCYAHTFFRLVIKVLFCINNSHLFCSPHLTYHSTLLLLFSESCD